MGVLEAGCVRLQAASSSQYLQMGGRGHLVTQAGEGKSEHQMPSKTGVSPLGKRFFVESFDVSSFIFLGSSHPFRLWSELTVGKSGAVWAKEYALVEETNDNFIENYKCDIWSSLPYISGMQEEESRFLVVFEYRKCLKST